MEEKIIYNCWLSPEGEVITCGFWEHVVAAFDIIDSKGWEEEFLEYTLGVVGNDCLEFLHRVKGFQRLHCLTYNDPREWVTDRRPTQLQLDKMYEITGYLPKNR